MLNRIVVLGNSKKVFKQVEKLAKTGDWIIDSVEADGAIPPATGAVIDGDADVGTAWEAALTLCGRHDALLYLLGDAVDCREAFAPGSSRRVAEHGERLAEALDLGQADRACLERAALLRDIGKLRIPNEALLKEGVLEYEEWLLLQQHPHIGADMVENLGHLADTSEIIRHHHECYDGDGYPQKIEGEKIPYLARVLKIVDVYCAMTSPRHYRTGHATPHEAIEHLEGERGKHFDPEMVDAFITNKVGQTGTEKGDG